MPVGPRDKSVPGNIVGCAVQAMRIPTGKNEESQPVRGVGGNPRTASLWPSRKRGIPRKSVSERMNG